MSKITAVENFNGSDFGHAMQNFSIALDTIESTKNFKDQSRRRRISENLVLK